MENIVVTTVRLEQRLLKELDRLAREENTDRTTIFKQALVAGIKEIKLRYALRFYQEGKISIGKAKEIAGVSLWELIDILKERSVGFKTDEEELRRQLIEFKK